MSEQNSTVTWVIQNFTKEFSYTELAQAVKDLGYPLIEIRGDYKREILRPLLDGQHHCVIFNGGIQMSKLAREALQTTCYPVSFNTFENYLCSKYYTYYGEYLFNDRYVMMSLREFNRNKFFIYGVLGREAMVFIRPDSGEKPFTAQLLDFQNVEQFCRENEPYLNELVVISTPKNIIWEGRFVVTREKDIIAYSTYRMQGQKTLVPFVPAETVAKCKELLEVGYYPDDVFCIDLCQDGDKNIWLLELTSFSSAGLYACDKAKIVKCVSDRALKAYDVFFKMTWQYHANT